MTRPALLLLTALLLAACTPPAPTPTPAPATADLSTLRPTVTAPTIRPSSTPFPPTILTPGTHPAPPEGETGTPESYPAATSTATPEPYPLATDDTQPYEQEGQGTEEPPRLGVAATLGKGYLFCDGRDWQSWWQGTHTIHERDCEGVAVLPQHVPMLVWSPVWFSPVKATLAAGFMEPDTWLVWNECEHWEQCNTPPEEAARFYHDTIVPFALNLDPEARLIVGGVNASDCGLDWLEQFVTYYRAEYGEDVPRTGYHFHLYPEVWAGDDCDQPWQWQWAILHNLETWWDAWLNDADNVKRFMLVYGREADEIWITEASCLAPPPSICQESSYAIAERMLAYYDNEGRWVDRYNWFGDGDLTGYWDHLNFYDGNHEDEPLVIRPLGELWLRYDPLPSIPLEIYERRFPIIWYGEAIPWRESGTPVPPAYP